MRSLVEIYKSGVGLIELEPRFYENLQSLSYFVLANLFVPYLISLLLLFLDWRMLRLLKSFQLFAAWLTQMSLYKVYGLS